MRAVYGKFGHSSVQQHFVAGGVSEKLNFNGLKSDGTAVGGKHLSIARQAVCRNVRWKITSLFVTSMD